MADSSLSLTQRLGNLSQLHYVRQLVLMLGLAASIALGAAVVIWSRAPVYQPLYSGLESADLSAIASVLDQHSIRYQANAIGGDITVESARLHDARLLLAGEGLPTSDRSSRSILDQEGGLGTSNFLEHARYTRALQDELVKTIESMQHIRQAWVHLSIPRQRSFIRSSISPSASVMVRLSPGGGLDDSQVAGIRHLLSASVTGLKSTDVSVVDQTGRLLSSEDDSPLAQSRWQMGIKQQLEDAYASRVISILTPLVGPGRVHANVNAELNFTEMETTREEYAPEAVVRSEQTDTEAVSRDPNYASVPGELLEVTVDGQEPPSRRLSEKRRSTLNYEIDRSISHVRTKPGSIDRINVAVLIDAPPPAAEGETAPTLERERLIELVKQTIGFSEARGDSVSLVESPFLELEAPAPPAHPSLLERVDFAQLARYGAAGAVILFLIFGVIRPVLNSSVATTSQLPVRLSQGGADNDAMQDQVTLAGRPGQGLPAPSHANLEQSLIQARSLVENEPARAARVLENWVNHDAS